VNSEKYIGLDVHHAIISVAVLDSTGKVVMKSILETKAATILQFFAELRGTLSVTLEEGTWAAWLYDLLKPHVANLVVCNPRKDALLKQGNKSDRIDARSYLTMVKDLTRVMSRLKAVYRSWAIPCAGRDVYYGRHRAEWLGKIEGGWGSAESRATVLAPGHAQRLRQQARRELLAESRKHPITAKFRQIPYVGPIRSALLVALLETPNRFLSKRQLWAYSGLALETRTSADHRYVQGQP
jgi:transposase